MKQEPTERAERLFSLGTILLTRRAADVLTDREILDALDRHQDGDWGNLPESERRANDEATKKGHRIMSHYELRRGAKFWVITEWDQSSTTVMLAKEFEPEPDEEQIGDELFDHYDWIEED